MKRTKNIFIGLLLIVVASCSPYDEFTEDVDFSIVYFGTQKPLRTIVAYDEMSIKVGVALGGKRTNETGETVDYVIEPALLEDLDIIGNHQFELLPSDYYTIEGAEMVVPAGEFIGDVTVRLNTALFTADEKSLTNHYAIPLKIMS